MGILGRKDFNVLLDRSAAIKHRSLHVWHIFAESGIFVLDLISQLSSRAHDQDRASSRNWLKLVESGQGKNSCLSETGLGLTENVDIKDSCWDADLLDCMGYVADMLDWFDPFQENAG